MSVYAFEETRPLAARITKLLDNFSGMKVTAFRQLNAY